MMVLQIPERVYCADVVYPMAIVGTAQRGIICYQLENQPSEVKRLESPLKYQVQFLQIVAYINMVWKQEIIMLSCFKVWKLQSFPHFF